MDGFLETLRRSGGVNAVANQLDLPPAIAASGVEALLPAVLSGFNRGLEAHVADTDREGLMALLDELGGGYLAADLISKGHADCARGDRILATIFGSKEISVAVAEDAARDCALDSMVLRRMLPLLAMLVGGYLAARVAGGKSVTQFDVGKAGDRLARAEAIVRGMA